MAENGKSDAAKGVMTPIPSLQDLEEDDEGLVKADSYNKLKQSNKEGDNEDWEEDTDDVWTEVEPRRRSTREKKQNPDLVIPQTAPVKKGESMRWGQGQGRKRTVSDAKGNGSKARKVDGKDGVVGIDQEQEPDDMVISTPRRDTSERKERPQGAMSAEALRLWDLKHEIVASGEQIGVEEAHHLVARLECKITQVDLNEDEEALLKHVQDGIINVDEIIQHELELKQRKEEDMNKEVQKEQSSDETGGNDAVLKFSSEEERKKEEDRITEEIRNEELRLRKVEEDAKEEERLDKEKRLAEERKRDRLRKESLRQQKDDEKEKKRLEKEKKEQEKAEENERKRREAPRKRKQQQEDDQRKRDQEKKEKDEKQKKKNDDNKEGGDKETARKEGSHSEEQEGKTEKKKKKAKSSRRRNKKRRDSSSSSSSDSSSDSTSSGESRRSKKRRRYNKAKKEKEAKQREEQRKEEMREWMEDARKENEVYQARFEEEERRRKEIEQELIKVNAEAEKGKTIVETDHLAQKEVEEKTGEKDKQGEQPQRSNRCAAHPLFQQYKEEDREAIAKAMEENIKVATEFMQHNKIVDEEGKPDIARITLSMFHAMSIQNFMIASLHRDTGNMMRAVDATQRMQMRSSFWLGGHNLGADTTDWLATEKAFQMLSHFTMPAQIQEGFQRHLIHAYWPHKDLLGYNKKDQKVISKRGLVTQNRLNLLVEGPMNYVQWLLVEGARQLAVLQKNKELKWISLEPFYGIGTQAQQDFLDEIIKDVSYDLHTVDKAKALPALKDYKAIRKGGTRNTDLVLIKANEREGTTIVYWNDLETNHITKNFLPKYRGTDIYKPIPIDMKTNFAPMVRRDHNYNPRNLALENFVMQERDHTSSKTLAEHYNDECRKLEKEHKITNVTFGTNTKAASKAARENNPDSAFYDDKLEPKVPDKKKRKQTEEEEIEEVSSEEESEGETISKEKRQQIKKERDEKREEASRKRHKRKREKDGREKEKVNEESEGQTDNLQASNNVQKDGQPITQQAPPNQTNMQQQHMQQQQMMVGPNGQYIQPGNLGYGMVAQQPTMAQQFIPNMAAYAPATAPQMQHLQNRMIAPYNMQQGQMPVNQHQAIPGSIYPPMNPVQQAYLPNWTGN